MADTVRLVRLERKKKYTTAAKKASENTLDLDSTASLRSEETIETSDDSKPTHEPSLDLTPTPGPTNRLSKSSLVQGSNPSQGSVAEVANTSVPDVSQEVPGCGEK